MSVASSTGPTSFLALSLPAFFPSCLSSLLIEANRRRPIIFLVQDFALPARRPPPFARRPPARLCPSSSSLGRSSSSSTCSPGAWITRHRRHPPIFTSCARARSIAAQHLAAIIAIMHYCIAAAAAFSHHCRHCIAIAPALSSSPSALHSSTPSPFAIITLLPSHCQHRHHCASRARSAQQHCNNNNLRPLHHCHFAIDRHRIARHRRPPITSPPAASPAAICP